MSDIKIACVTAACNGFVNYTPWEIPIFLAFKQQLGERIFEIVPHEEYKPVLRVLSKQTEKDTKTVYLTCIPNNHTNAYQILD